MDVEIDPKTGNLHAYAKIFDNSWYPHSPGFLPTAVVVHPRWERDQRWLGWSTEAVTTLPCA